MVNHDEMKMKMEKKSHRYNKNNLRPKYGHKYRKCLHMMLLISIKQHLSNIRSSVYEKVKEH